MTKLPSQNPASYKTDRGLFNAFIRALGAPPCCNRAWWLHNAMRVAEDRSAILFGQFGRLMNEAAPKTIDDLLPIGHSFPAR
jgi:hypothetical protein